MIVRSFSWIKHRPFIHLFTHDFSVSRQELVGWLQQQISEQKRIDATTSGAPAVSEAYQGPVQSKDTGNAPEVQLVLPVDTKKQRKQTKQIFLDRGQSRCHLILFPQF